LKCLGCDKLFMPTRRWQKFCDKKCKSNYHNQKKADMGKTFAELAPEERQLVMEFIEAASLNPELLDKLAEKLKEGS
jgi:hypothetical protein